MKILHVNDQLIFGGIPSVKLLEVRGLRELGFESLLWFRSVSEAAALEPFKREFPVFVGPRPLLRSVIAQHHFDLIHVTIWTMYYALPAIVSCGFEGPVVLSSHQGTPTDPIHPRVDHLLSVSEAGRGCILDPIGRPCEVIYNGVETTQFSPDRPPACDPAWSRPSGERPIVLWIGRVGDWRKNFPGLVAASDRIQQAGFDVWALHSDEYPPARSLECGLGQSRVVMTRGVPYDRMPDVFALVRQSGGCLWLNSFTESFGMVVAEAMSGGCPVVAARVGGVPELIDHGVTGWLYEADQPLDGVVTLIANAIHGEERGAVTARARQRVLDRFDSSVFAQHYAAFYRCLVAEPSYRHPLTLRQRLVRSYLRLGEVLPVLIPSSRWT